MKSHARPSEKKVRSAQDSTAGPAVSATTPDETSETKGGTAHAASDKSGIRSACNAISLKL